MPKETVICQSHRDRKAVIEKRPGGVVGWWVYSDDVSPGWISPELLLELARKTYPGQEVWLA